MASDVTVKLNFKIATAKDKASELSNEKGETKYVVGTTVKPAVSPASIGQYVIGVNMSAADIQIWKDSIISQGKSSETEDFTLSAVAKNDTNKVVYAVLLKANATSTAEKNGQGTSLGENTNVVTSHTITVTMTSAGALSISAINGDTSPTVVSSNASFHVAADYDSTYTYATSATNALYGLRPYYDADTYTTDEYDAYPTNGKYTTNLFSMAD